MIGISKLRHIGMISDDGSIVDYPELTEKQNCMVIKKVLDIINSHGCKINGCDVDQVRLNIDMYLQKVHSAGRTIHNGFPEFIIKDLISNYAPKLIDYLLLDED